MNDFCAVRELTERLAAPLSAEDQTVQSMPDVSPTKWHRAHTTWFFETFVLGPGYRPYDERYAYLFNSYYEVVGPRHARSERGLITRPGIAEIAAYRAHVDAAMRELLAGELAPETARLVELGLHHEQQHQELLVMDIQHVLSCNPLQPAYGALPWSTPVPVAGDDWHEHPGGIVEVGHAGDGFAFDNEGPRHEVLLRPFRIAASLVTCREWLAFIDDGGYRRPELWMSDGWHTVKANAWEAPGYWHRDGDGWLRFGLDGLQPVDPAAPVLHVSWYEADAFARWAGCRLFARTEPSVPFSRKVDAGAGQVARRTVIAAVTAAAMSASREPGAAGIGTGTRRGSAGSSGRGAGAAIASASTSTSGSSVARPAPSPASADRHRSSTAGSIDTSSARTSSTARACLHAPDVSASGQLHSRAISSAPGTSPSSPSPSAAGSVCSATAYGSAREPCTTPRATPGWTSMSTTAPSRA
jgi:ergothioneine biosynthesis protein EgtB